MRASHRRRGTGLLRLVAGTTLVAGGVALVATPAGATTVTLTTCSSSHFRSAAGSSGTITFKVASACTITLTSAIDFPAKVDVTIDNIGGSVDIYGGDANRLFDVSGGQLSITGVTLSGGLARGATGGDGANGTDAVPGTAGKAGTGTSAGGNGGNGTVGTAGGAGKAGQSVSGGALAITSGTVTLRSDTLVGDEAMGGSGGQGGTGGVGSTGGSGGSGGTGAKGGNGGAGGKPGDGGAGGAGGKALGGAIYNAGP
jgi:hypothetical protein